MEKITIKDLKIKKGKKINKDQYLAEEVWRYFGKKLSFGLIMKCIKNKGWQFIFETFKEIKNSDVENRIKLFMWKIGKTKIVDIKKETTN